MIIIFLILNLKVEPFSMKTLNDLETISLIAAMITLYCGIFYLVDLPEIYKSGDPTLMAVDNKGKTFE